MKNKLILCLICFFILYPYLTWTLIQGWPRSAISSTHPTETYMPTQENVALANANLNQMCHAAATFGYEAVDKGLSKEQMHQELKEILK